MAVLAHRPKIPLYVACLLSTIDMSIGDGSQIPIEKRDPNEVLGFGGIRTAADGVSIRNPSFDVTPAELVTALISEKGVMPKPDLAKLQLITGN